MMVVPLPVVVTAMSVVADYAALTLTVSFGKKISVGVVTNVAWHIKNVAKDAATTTIVALATLATSY